MGRRMELALVGSCFSAMALRAGSVLASGPTSNRVIGPSLAVAAADDRMVLAMAIGVLATVGVLDVVRRLIDRGWSGRGDDDGA